jgi:hypothetical protein
MALVICDPNVSGCRIDVPKTQERKLSLLISQRSFGQSYLEAEDLGLDVLEGTAVDLDKTLASL